MNIKALHNATNRMCILLQDELHKLNDMMLDSVSRNKSKLLPIVSEYLLMSGGKRLRPLLTIASAKAMGYTRSEDLHIQLAVAIEYIHAASLLHDDIIDESTTRRFNPTAHSIWGDKATILVGDYLFTQSFHLMLKTQSVAILEVLSKAASAISEAELWQLDLIQQKEIRISEYMDMIKAKTASLFSAAAHVGAMIATDYDLMLDDIYKMKIQKCFSEFGMNFGIIFQIVDDVLDYYGQNEQIGKETIQDIKQNKITLPLILLYKKIDQKEKVMLQNSISNKDYDGLGPAITSLMNKYSVMDDIQSFITPYIQRAELQLDQIEEFIANTDSNIGMMRDLLNGLSSTIR
mgnify:CR=1 FL=1